MADINNLVPFILKWEGGYVNDSNDLGGPTNDGVTLKTWQNYGYDKNDDGKIDEEDLKLLFRQDLIECVLRPHYWNRWQADKIENQSIANLLVDWLWMSGVTGIKTPQRMLNLNPDGIVGEKTLAAINNYPDQSELFKRFKAERIGCIEQICSARPANNRFKKGWLNRLNDLKFALTIVTIFMMTFLPGCKSVKTTENTRIENQSVIRSEKESEERMQTQQSNRFSGRGESTETTETVTETITVRFDTTPKSPERGCHFKEVSRTVTTRGRVLKTSIAGESGSIRIDSATVVNRETTDLQVKENIRCTTVAVSGKSRWLFMILVPLIIVAGIAWVIKKRILNLKNRWNQL